MARITVKIEPLHPDGSICNHAIRPSGKPRDPNSGTGRRSYRVQRSTCGTVGTPHGLRVLAEPEQTKHRQEHQAALAKPLTLLQARLPNPGRRAWPSCCPTLEDPCTTPAPWSASPPPTSTTPPKTCEISVSRAIRD
jgi:hypothetical protein